MLVTGTLPGQPGCHGILHGQQRRTAGREPVRLDGKGIDLPGISVYVYIKGSTRTCCVWPAQASKGRAGVTGAAMSRRDPGGGPAMDRSAQLDLDLSALELDDFEVADDALTLESLTAGYAAYRCGCSHYCACPCICCQKS